MLENMQNKRVILERKEKNKMSSKIALGFPWWFSG